jgi:hypothetical protein
MVSFEQRGVQGYTGYVPSGQTIMVAIKDTTQRTGLVRASLSRRGLGGLVIDAPLTETQTAYTMTPEMFPKDMASKAGGAMSPYNPFQDGKAIVSKPFVAESTYRQEMLAGARKTEQVLAGGPFIGGALRPEASGLSNILYQTETAVRQAEALEVANVYRPHVNTGGYEPLPPAPSAKERERLEREFKSIEQSASRAHFDTSYRRSYGGRDFNPRSVVPLTTHDLSLKASTREFFSGTPKAVEHLPGYCGFVAAAPNNRHAVAHSMRVQKPSTKLMLLSTLGQYPRNVPGYLGFQPGAHVNQSERNRDLDTTTAGHADLTGTNGFVPGRHGTSLSAKAAVAYEPSAVGISNGIVSGFFTHAALTVSENGVQNAEAYYTLLRPLEGRSAAIIKAVPQAPILTNMV